MKILISPISKHEAILVAQSSADIVDVKNVQEGSLGAQLPQVTREIVEAIRPFSKECSGTLGDLPYKPGTAALAALGLASCGIDYIKAGLFGPKNYLEAYNMITAIVEATKTLYPKIKTVASGYADWRRFNGLSPYDLIEAGKKTEVDIVMVDTAIKDGSTLFDVMTYAEIQQFVQQAKANQLQVALAGSLNASHLSKLMELSPDIIGVRGAVCSKGNRNLGITRQSLSDFLYLVDNAKGKGQ